MKLKYHYTYPEYLKVAVIAASVFGFFFIGFGFLCLSGLLRSRLSNADIYVFVGLFLGFGGFGMLFLAAALLFHRNMKRMATSADWFGITLEENTLISQDSGGFWRQKPQQIDKYEIEKSELRIYKGVEVLTVKTAKRTLFLSVNLLTQEDRAKLLAFAVPASLSERPISEGDLRKAAAFLAAVETTFNYKFPRNAKRIGDFDYIFGFEADFKKHPHFTLCKNGSLGDTYSGYQQYSNDFALANFLDNVNQPLKINLIEMEHDLAGYRFDFYYSDRISREIQDLFSGNFYRFMDVKIPVPESFLKLLAKSHNS